MVEKLLGKLPKKPDHRNLMAANYLADSAPTHYDFMHGRRNLPARTFGNTRYGDCTRASQGNALMRFERVEQRRTIVLPDQVVIDAYLRMTGGQDNGAFELDALKDWRSVGFVMPDRANRLYKIDAFAEVPINVDAIKAAMFGFKLIKICLGLPRAWQNIDPFPIPNDPSHPIIWDVGEGPEFQPWSWGGHSMTADAYDAEGLFVVHTWYEGPKAVRQKVSWAAVQRYADEAYTVVDSIDEWRQKPVARIVDLNRLERDVARVTAE